MSALGVSKDETSSSFRQLLAGQDGVDALDRGDHDLCILVEARRAKLLHIVDFGKRSSGSGRAISEIFVAGLAHQIGAVGEKQNALEPGVREQPVTQRAGGEGLAGAGCHLHQRARMVLRHRTFERRHGINLAGAQAVREQSRHGLKSTAQSEWLSELALQRLRPMEGKDAARHRIRVGVVAKQRLGA